MNGTYYVLLITLILSQSLKYNTINNGKIYYYVFYNLNALKLQIQTKPCIHRHNLRDTLTYPYL